MYFIITQYTIEPHQHIIRDCKNINYATTVSISGRGLWLPGLFSLSPECGPGSRATNPRTASRAVFDVTQSTLRY